MSSDSETLEEAKIDYLVEDQRMDSDHKAIEAMLEDAVQTPVFPSSKN